MSDKEPASEQIEGTQGQAHERASPPSRDDQSPGRPAAPDADPTATPRTDAKYRDLNGRPDNTWRPAFMLMADFARELERELTAERGKIAQADASAPVVQEPIAGINSAGELVWYAYFSAQPGMKLYAASGQDAARLRQKVTHQRRELRRLNRYLGPYWAGFRKGAAVEAECKLRGIMNAAFGHDKVFAAEQAAIAARIAKEWT